LSEERLRLYLAKVKFLRNVKGLKQREVAEILGIVKNSYGNFEQGSRFLSMEYIEKLSKILGENLEDETLREYVNSKAREKRSGGK